MPATTDISLEHADALFRGLGDPTRLRILNLLAAGELCVCDVVELLDLPQSTVSRHLGYLLRARWVSVSRVAKFAHYRLADPASDLHHHLLQGVKAQFGSIERLTGERATAESRVRAREANPC